MRTPPANTLCSTLTLEEDGFAILHGVFGQSQVERLIEAVSTIVADGAVRSRGGVYAVRNLLQLSPVIFALSHLDKLLALVEENLGIPAFPVRGTLFDKTASANWLVPWHQDLTISVTSRADVPGYGPWTVKAGVCHVQPSVSIWRVWFQFASTLTPVTSPAALCVCFPEPTGSAASLPSKYQNTSIPPQPSPSPRDPGTWF